MKYGIVLMEKYGEKGLTIEETSSLFNVLDSKEGYPIEFFAKECEVSAMGFITRESADVCDFDYKRSGLNEFIANVLDKENSSDRVIETEFKGIKICIIR